MLNKSILENPEVLQESVSVFSEYTTCFQASSPYLVDRLYPVNTRTPFLTALFKRILICLLSSYANKLRKELKRL
jgi:hypothetical protein